MWKVWGTAQMPTAYSLYKSVVSLSVYKTMHKTAFLVGAVEVLLWSPRSLITQAPFGYIPRRASHSADDYLCHHKTEVPI